jgi:NAD+ diphosphatase
MLRCPNCGNLIFPRISPAVIIGVTNGEKLLMSKYAGRAYTRYALIAGFTEIGETLEETVKREVMEEVGLHVKNIRYYKSQPWGRDGGVLMGFFCDLDGSDEIHLDEKELALAEWHERSALPAEDDGISLTREMMRVFEEGREPK